MPEYDPQREFARGLAELQSGSTLAAMVHFERAAVQAPCAIYRSYLGYCLAKERGQVQKGLELCREAVAEDSLNPELHLNLGKTLLVAGNKLEALLVLREGMSISPHPAIVELLDLLGVRRSPPLSFLSRNNPINKYLGILLSRLGLR